MRAFALKGAVIALGTIISLGAAQAEEQYSLVHAIGNDENVVASDMTKSECETRKKEYKAVATQLGTYNEATGYGSIVCLQESWL